MKTKQGNVLLEIGATAENWLKFSDALKEAISDMMAFTTLNESAARSLERVARLKVGWVYCRVRVRPKVARCFRCFGYGHIATECKDKDRTKKCWRCDSERHSQNGENTAWKYKPLQVGPRTDDPTCIWTKNRYLYYLWTVSARSPNKKKLVFWPKFHCSHLGQRSQ